MTSESAQPWKALWEGVGSLSREGFECLRQAYEARHGYALLYVGESGAVIYGQGKDGVTAAARRKALDECLRWGEPVMLASVGDTLMWGVPVMVNGSRCGGLVVEGVAWVDEEEQGEAEVRRLGEASLGLLQVALDAQVTNGALLRLAALEMARERARAEAIHAWKDFPYEGVRAMYLREEQSLLGAVRSGQRAEARAILNRILVAAYGRGTGDLERLKGVLLELIVMMSRAAYEMGARPNGAPNFDFAALSALSGVEDEEALAAWITRMLETIMDSVEEVETPPVEALMARAQAYMEAHLGRPLGRDEVARSVGMSPSHFSHLMAEKTGRTFSETLVAVRVGRACERLGRTRDTLAQVAMDCGFCDQSHLTRAFRRVMGMTPGAYRRRHAAGRRG